GWTSLTGKSLWNFVNYLDDKIQKILENIGTEKFIGIVTDADANINLARKQISQKYSHILNIRCVTTVYEMLKSVYQLEIYLKEIINKNLSVITNESVKTIICRKRGFFNDVYNLAKIFKPIKEAIIKLESRNAILADLFNSRFDEYEFDEYLLTYFLHPDYKGIGIQKNKFLRIATSAANIWQQIIKIPEIASQLKKYKHSKQQLGYTYCQEHTVEEIYQKLYNAQIEKDEKENKNEIKNQLNVNLNEYNEKDLDDKQET
ncbi:36434_t:CDS:2, partial [Racocetra persica]